MADHDNRYFWGELVPRRGPHPSLGFIPPRVLIAGQRFNELETKFSEMSSMVTSAPRATVKVADIARANPPIELHTCALPWKNAEALTYLVSEVLHHLRTAADQLIYNVAWIDSGSEQQQTQFPVSRSKKDFERERKQRLRGFSSEHVEWIEEVQPYNNVKWTNLLQLLSNADKHNYPLEITPTIRWRCDLHAATVDPQDSTLAQIPVEDIKVLLRYLPKEAGQVERIDVELGNILQGFCALLNRFLAEAGISEVKFSLDS